ncbi:Type II/IV secretion system protein [uncultured archaeon]|nr:Type II/IV secretion system protein [uncultured archaeon]
MVQMENKSESEENVKLSSELSVSRKGRKRKGIRKDKVLSDKNQTPETVLKPDKPIEKPEYDENKNKINVAEKESSGEKHQDLKSDKEPKQELKEEPKEVAKEEPKEELNQVDKEPKEELKEEPKEVAKESKEELKEEPKEVAKEPKEELKEESIKRSDETTTKKETKPPVGSSNNPKELPGVDEHKTKIKKISEPDKVSGQEKNSSSNDVKVREERKTEKLSENKTGNKKPERGKKEGKPVREEKRPSEEMGAIMERLGVDTTKDLIKEKMTPEKQAVYEILEDKLVSDIETRVKKLAEMQSLDNVEKPKSLMGKIKLVLTKEESDKELYDPSVHGPLVMYDGISGYNELERYWVNEPYALVVILFNPEKNSNLYYVVEPKLSDFEELFLKEIKDRLKDVLLFEDIKNDEDKNKTLTDKVKKLVKEYSIDVSPLTTEKILYYTRRDFIKFGKIDPLMHDDRIEDVSANGFGVPIYLYHKKYTNLATNIVYREDELDSYVIRLAQRCGKHISVAEPMIDATMPDGSRIQMTLGKNITTHGATFTIRKFSEVPITPVDLINWNTFSAEEMAYLWLCIENNKSLIYAGGTASGKTSSLNAVSLFIPWQAKIITLEDTRELKLPHPNWIPGVTRDSFTADGKGTIDMYDLLKAALRQRPEFLLVGEVRGKEALTLFQAMSTGHTTFSTMHADSVSSAIHRLENPPISVPRTMIQALNIISIQSQTFVKGKRARRNMKLVEITDIDPTTRNIRTNDIFAWDALTDKFNRVGDSKALNEIMVRRGWNIADLKKELMNRQKILEFMVNNKISDFNAIATIIHDYQVTPDKVLKKLLISG